MPDQRPESLDPSDDDLVNREADPAAAKARAKAQRPWYKKKRWLLAIAFALLVATAPLVPDAEVKPSRSTVAAQAFDPQSEADERRVNRFFEALGPLSAAQASARLKQDLQGYLAPLDAYADVQDRFVQLADEEEATGTPTDDAEVDRLSVDFRTRSAAVERNERQLEDRLLRAAPADERDALRERIEQRRRSFEAARP